MTDQTLRADAERGVTALLALMGDDPARAGVLDTPRRVVDAMTAYAIRDEDDVASLLAVQFTEACDQMVVVGPVAFTSLCEHHLLPFHGHAHLAYIPSAGRIAGLSKLPRVLDHYAARPQVQERLTEQVADALDKHLEPQGVAVLLRARHICLTLRGARKEDAVMTTSALRGAFFDRPAARAELLSLIGVGDASP